VDGVLNEWSGATAIQFSGRSNNVTALSPLGRHEPVRGFQVSDSQPERHPHGAGCRRIYLDDSVEIYIDTRNDRATMMQPRRLSVPGQSQ